MTGPEGSAAGTAGARAERLHDLGERARDLEDGLNEAEGWSAETIRERILPSLHELSGQVRALLESLLAIYEPEGGAEDGLAGLLFCALRELRSREDVLRRAAPREPLPLVAACGSLLRNQKRALTAVQQALCERHGLQPTMSLDRELAVALEVRADYEKFRTEIEAIHEDFALDGEDAGPALVSAATSIAKLTGRDIFPLLRLQDRIQVHALQERILAWKRGGRVATEARRLWQDLYAFTQLLQEVNRRQELLEHDRKASGS
jgi:hypothetical protein